VTLPRFALVHSGGFPPIDTVRARLREEGVELDVYLLEPAREARGASVPVAARWSPAAAITVPVLAARWEQQRPTLVHVDEGPGALRSLVAARLLRIPVCTVSMSGLSDEPHAGSRVPPAAQLRMRRARAQAVGRLADATLAMDRATARFLSAVPNLRPPHVFPVGLGLETDRLLTEVPAERRRADGLKALGLRPEERFLVFPFRTAEGRERGIAFAEALRRVRAGLQVIGLDESGGRSSEATEVRPSTRIVSLRREDVTAWVDAADLVIELDVAGASMLPAVAALRRCPVGTAQTPATGGLLVPGETAWPLGTTGVEQAQAVSALLSNTWERERLASRARSWAARAFDRDIATERLLRLWSNELSGQRTSGDGAR
jgi:hypothetical protein